MAVLDERPHGSAGGVGAQGAARQSSDDVWSVDVEGSTERHQLDAVHGVQGNHGKAVKGLEIQRLENHEQDLSR